MYSPLWLTMFVPIVMAASHPAGAIQQSLQRRLTTHGAAPLQVAQVDDPSMLSSTTEQQSFGGIMDAPDVAEIVPTHAIDRHRGVFLTAGSIARSDIYEKALSNIDAVQGNSLVFDVKGNTVYFDSEAPMARSLGLISSIYSLKSTVDDLHARGLYAIARYVAISDPGITGKLPETQVTHPKTGTILSYGYIDPNNETALEYNSQVLCEVAAAGVDEINLDYIRFSTANFGALRVFSGQEKADRVETFIRMARETIDRCGPGVKLGISTFAILGWNYDINVATLGQDVVRFASLVDIISPMAYPATFTSDSYYDPARNKGSRMYSLVYRTLTGYQKLLGEDAWKLRPWLQGYSITAQNVRDQMQAVKDAGLCGFQFWNASNNYPSVFQAMKGWDEGEGCRESGGG